MRKLNIFLILLLSALLTVSAYMIWNEISIQIREKDFDIILSHTCPFKYEPREMFLAVIDQSTVDTSTERWLDTIELLE